MEQQYQEGEVVWHTSFKCKVKFLLEMKPLKGRWFYIKLPNGGFMETQKIEKYNGQCEKINR